MGPNFDIINNKHKLKHNLGMMISYPNKDFRNKKK